MQTTVPESTIGSLCLNPKRKDFRKRVIPQARPKPMAAPASTRANTSRNNAMMLRRSESYSYPYLAGAARHHIGHRAIQPNACDC